MRTPQPYREYEHKILLHQNDIALIPDELITAPQRSIEQYYLNTPHEPYELRLRSSELGDNSEYVATIKKGSPPDRLEMETPISADTYHLWKDAAKTEVICKKRRTLEMAAGHWALDSFTHLKFTLLEAEGDVPLPTFGRNVTHDTRFTNYELAQMNDAMLGSMPESFKKPTEPSDIAPLRARIEHLRNIMNRPIIIGVAGDTGSGKTTLAKQLAKPYGNLVEIISQDDYYRGVTQLREMFGEDYQPNFDAPISIDHVKLAQHLSDLQAELPIERPTYSMATSDPTGELTHIDPAQKRVIFVEGIHALERTLQGWYDYTIFVNAPLATRVGRRLERDLKEGRSFSPEDNLRYLMEVAEPTYRPYGQKQKAAADLIYHT